MCRRIFNILCCRNNTIQPTMNAENRGNRYRRNNRESFYRRNNRGSRYRVQRNEAIEFAKEVLNTHKSVYENVTPDELINLLPHPKIDSIKLLKKIFILVPDYIFDLNLTDYPNWLLFKITDTDLPIEIKKQFIKLVITYDQISSISLYKSQFIENSEFAFTNEEKLDLNIKLLHSAIRHNNIEEVQSLTATFINQNQLITALETHDKNNYTPLYTAIKYGHGEVARYLLDALYRYEDDTQKKGTIPTLRFKRFLEDIMNGAEEEHFSVRDVFLVSTNKTIAENAHPSFFDKGHLEGYFLDYKEGLNRSNENLKCAAYFPFWN